MNNFQIVIDIVDRLFESGIKMNQSEEGLFLSEVLTALDAKDERYNDWNETVRTEVKKRTKDWKRSWLKAQGTTEAEKTLTPRKRNKSGDRINLDEEILVSFVECWDTFSILRKIYAKGVHIPAGVPERAFCNKLVRAKVLSFKRKPASDHPDKEKDMGEYTLAPMGANILREFNR